MFQSLIGFKINWNTPQFTRISKESKFQSLIGFKINWNARACSGIRKNKMFQSLIGFKINWNSETQSQQGFTKGVSIPNRV